MPDYKRAFEIVKDKFNIELTNGQLVIESKKIYFGNLAVGKITKDEHDFLDKCLNAEEDSLDKIIEEFEKEGWYYYPTPTSLELDFRLYPTNNRFIFDELIITKENGIFISLHSKLSLEAISLINRIYRLWGVEV